MKRNASPIHFEFLACNMLPFKPGTKPGEVMENEARCVNCGSNIEKDYILFINGAEFIFDSFECAINFVAPRCAHCNSVIMGRGSKIDEDYFCSLQCSSEKNYSQLVP